MAGMESTANIISPTSITIKQANCGVIRNFLSYSPTGEMWFRFSPLLFYCQDAVGKCNNRVHYRLCTPRTKNRDAASPSRLDKLSSHGNTLFKKLAMAWQIGARPCKCVRVWGACGMRVGSSVGALGGRDTGGSSSSSSPANTSFAAATTKMPEKGGWGGRGRGAFITNPKRLTMHRGGESVQSESHDRR